MGKNSRKRKELDDENAKKRARKRSERSHSREKRSRSFSRSDRESFQSRPSVPSSRSSRSSSRQSPSHSDTNSHSGGFEVRFSNLEEKVNRLFEVLIHDPTGPVSNLPLNSGPPSGEVPLTETSINPSGVAQDVRQDAAQLNETETSKQPASKSDTTGKNSSG